MRPTRLNDASDEAASASEERSLRTMRKASRILEVAFFAIAGLFIAAFVALTAFSFVGADWSALTPSSLAEEALSAIGLIITSAMLITAGMVFRDVSNGETPFTAKQARRINVIAWLLLAYAFVDSILPSGVVMAANMDGTVLGINRNVSDIPSIRLGTILVALVFFFLSTVFKYGVKLQELSDDTV